MTEFSRRSWASGSQTFSDRVPFVDLLLSPRIRKTDFAKCNSIKDWKTRIDANATSTKWLREIIIAIFRNQQGKQTTQKSRNLLA